MTLEEFKKQYPEYCSKTKENKNNQMKFLCQCRNGDVFDYRNRIKFNIGNNYYAPCQGKCPYCGTTEFTFIGSSLYPIKFNFTG